MDLYDENLILLQVATSNVLVDKMKKSEKEVIKEWLENIFKTWEKTNDLEIKEFKLTQLKHDTSVLNVENGGLGSVGLIRLNGASNGQCGSHHQQDTDIDRLVSNYSVQWDNWQQTH